MMDVCLAGSLDGLAMATGWASVSLMTMGAEKWAKEGKNEGISCFSSPAASAKCAQDPKTKYAIMSQSPTPPSASRYINPLPVDH